MIGTVPSEALEPPTARRTNHGHGLLIVFTAAITVAAPLLVPMTAYYLNLLMQTSTYAVAVVGLTIVAGLYRPDQSCAGRLFWFGRL